MTEIASVILPAHDEAALIGPCLAALFASDPLPKGWRGEVIVVANGCTDATAVKAREMAGCAQAAGWDLRVIETPQGGKLRALDLGDAVARGGLRIYLDADVILSAPLMGQIIAALDRPAALYASGTPRIAPAQSRITRAYARFWAGLPFLQDGVPGFGLFAVNAAGRARWGAFPDIISDDTFVRLHFAPSERVGVAARYDWPMVEGFANLVRVRRRQDAGVAEIDARYPALRGNDDKVRLTKRALAGLALRDPVGFAVYAAVSLAVRTPLFRSRQVWARGR